MTLRHLIRDLSRRVRAWGLLLSVGGMLTAVSTAAEIDFNREIRPILSDKCFQCHGADEAGREAELRLDLRDAAIQSRDDGAAINPGHPEQSQLVSRILARDADLRMPPAHSQKSLTPREIELLQEWIRQGANYAEHWAFEPVLAPAIPDSRSDAWCRNPIDAFVLQQLQQRGVRPSGEAPRRTLIRRLYVDLLGVVPTPEEVSVFVNDTAPDAWERLVENVLANPHYGERWGRHWLDQARYADSNGFTIDGARIMWPYRDWVVHALNTDLPFDQFTIEQLAGDLLPAPTKSQLVATGFHRNTLINQEGGVKPDQYRHEAVIDRVNTTGAVWLGLTLGCAQCHSHKFDPISHAEYYQFYAFFNRCKDANDTSTTMEVFQGEMFGLNATQRAQLDELQALRKQLRNEESQLRQAANATLQSATWNWVPAEIADYSTQANGTFQRLPDGSLLSDRNGNENDTYRVTLRVPRGPLTALRLRVLPHPSLPHQGPGLAGNGNFILTNLAIFSGDRLLSAARAWADHEQPEFPASATIDKSPASGWAINVSAEQVSQRPGLKMNAAHELIVQLGKPLKIEGDDATVSVVLEHGMNMRYLIGRFAIDVSTATPVTPQAPTTSELAELKEQIQRLEEQLQGRGLAENQMVMSDMDQPPPTYRLARGDFLQPAVDEGSLQPGVPAALTRHLATLPHFENRLDLARWLVSPENPLTARVTVNRIWLKYFGRGLVDTENDFGFQSQPPSHPELLDWLAAEFISQNWSLKQMHRLIVCSATYRQESRFRDDLLQNDPGNLWLARQSRLRVEAEIVRDLALSASGQLTPRLGGPSVYPPQPDGVYSFTQEKKSWPESHGPDRYRRTMYTMFYRSAPYPLFTTFDAPDFNSVCTRRLRSNTPLQALTLANDVVFVELAQALAAHVAGMDSSGDTFAVRLDRMFMLAFCRSPDAQEVELLQSYWEQEQQRYSGDSSAATKLAPETLWGDQQAAGAAWTNVARVILNTDEFVTRN